MDFRQVSNRNKYNIAASVYGFIAFVMSLGQARKLYREVASRLDCPLGGKIIELGCGPGSVIPALLEKLDKKTDIIGIDFSEKMIALANQMKSKNNWENVTFECVDMYQYNPEQKADTVIFCLALTAIPNYEKALDKAVSLLNPNGQLIILDSIPLKGKWHYLLANFYTNFKSLIVGAKPERGIIEHIEKKMEIIENKALVGGVYSLINAKLKNVNI